MLSLESKLESLKKKYTSGAKEKSSYSNNNGKAQLSAINEHQLKRPVSPTPVSAQ